MAQLVRVNGQNVRPQVAKVLQPRHPLGQRAGVVPADIGHGQGFFVDGLVEQIAGPVIVHGQIQHGGVARLLGQLGIEARRIRRADGKGGHPEFGQDKGDDDQGQGKVTAGLGIGDLGLGIWDLARSLPFSPSPLFLNSQPPIPNP